jgi:hypothetical protein
VMGRQGREDKRRWARKTRGVGGKDKAEGRVGGCKVSELEALCNGRRTYGPP